MRNRQRRDARERVAARLEMVRGVSAKPRRRDEWSFKVHPEDRAGGVGGLANRLGDGGGDRLESFQR
jgi:hypothetical protein